VREDSSEKKIEPVHRIRRAMWNVFVRQGWLTRGASLNMSKSVVQPSKASFNPYPTVAWSRLKKGPSQKGPETTIQKGKHRLHWSW
jgi:hypothetical protein